jgi:hypothetical protein
MTAVTCRTEGCLNYGQPVEVNMQYEDETGTHEVDQVICGPCGQPIEEIG